MAIGLGSSELVLPAPHEDFPPGQVEGERRGSGALTLGQKGAQDLVAAPACALQPHYSVNICKPDLCCFSGKPLMAESQRARSCLGMQPLSWSHALQWETEW